MFQNSIIVSAHPDDEILWFSSIIEKVNKVVICFLNCKSHPEWGEGRQKSLQEHPISNISCLGLEEAEIFNSADWLNPVTTNVGMEIPGKLVSHKKYEENYYKLKSALENKLTRYENIFTHNPWGEYGNEEHVQIYRVVKDLQREKKFNLWFSNYCSNNSFNLMLNYISGFDSEYVTLKTDKTIGNHVKDIYTKNQCWTWYDDWEWFSEESFMKDKDLQAEKKDHGHIFPINIIKFNYPGMPKEETKKEYVRIAQLRRFIGSLLGKAGLRRS